jgi:hypothetical protein
MLDGFIVLGLVPGTQIQITFYTWLVIISCLSVIVMFWRSYRTALLQRFIITTSIIAHTHRSLPEQLSLLA